MAGAGGRTIRDAVSADRPACVALWVSACEARDGAAHDGVAERADAKFDRVAAWLVAETDGRLDGFVLATIPGSGASTDPDGSVVLGLLAVGPGVQGAGLGRELLRRVTTRLADSGHTLAVLHALADNVSALRLYESEKWVPTGAVQEHPLLGRPFLTLVRHLDDAAEPRG